MTSRLGRSSKGFLRLERTGPFVPPISFPHGSIVVTSEFQKTLDKSDFGPFQYMPVEKAHVRDLRWEHLDRTALPPSISDAGDPEYLILGGPHSPKAASMMGDLFEVKLKAGAKVTSEKIRESRRIKYISRVDPESWDGSSLFHPEGKLLRIATEEFALWLGRQAPQWFSTEPCQSWK